MKIGNRKLLLSNVLLVPFGEAVEFEYEITPNDMLKCKLEFMDEQMADSQEKKSTVKIEAINDTCIIKFINFDTGWGQTFNQPLVFGVTDSGNEISMTAAVYKFKTLYKIEMQIMVEEAVK